MTTETRQRDDGNWSPCPSGEIGGLVGRLQTRHRRRAARQMAAGVSCLALLLVAGAYTVPRLGITEPDFGGISCSEVRPMTREYLAQTLDAPTAARIDAHLAECNHCRLFVDELRAKLEQERSASVRTVQSSRSGHRTMPLLLADTSH